MAADNSSPTKAFSVWSYKPWWCQPWSILLTGSWLIAASWFFVKSVGLTLLVSAAIAGWWGYFLLLWPRAVARAVAEEASESEPQI